jgi:hypothetical protein
VHRRLPTIAKGRVETFCDLVCAKANRARTQPHRLDLNRLNQSSAQAEAAKLRFEPNHSKGNRIVVPKREGTADNVARAHNDQHQGAIRVESTREIGKPPVFVSDCRTELRAHRVKCLCELIQRGDTSKDKVCALPLAFHRH